MCCLKVYMKESRVDTIIFLMHFQLFLYKLMLSHCFVCHITGLFVMTI